MQPNPNPQPKTLTPYKPNLRLRTSLIQPQLFVDSRWFLLYSHLTWNLVRFVSSVSFCKYYYYNQTTFFLCTLHFYSIFLGPAINDSLPDYDIIKETDPYYWSINEFDMLSKFNDEIADQAAVTDTMKSPVSGYSPPPPVMCAQRALDNMEIHENRAIECNSGTKRVYRKIPVPNRKLTRSSESTTASRSISIPPDVRSQVRGKSKLPSHKSQLRTHEGEGLTIDSNNATTDRLLHPTADENTMPTLMDKKSEDTSSQPEYCNMDMLNALSVHDVYTIWACLAIGKMAASVSYCRILIMSMGGISSQVVYGLLDKSLLWISFLKMLYRGIILQQCDNFVTFDVNCGWFCSQSWLIWQKISTGPFKL